MTGAPTPPRLEDWYVRAWTAGFTGAVSAFGRGDPAVNLPDGVADSVAGFEAFRDGVDEGWRWASERSLRERAGLADELPVVPWIVSPGNRGRLRRSLAWLREDHAAALPGWAWLALGASVGANLVRLVSLPF